jgi:hypothetical protein
MGSVIVSFPVIDNTVQANKVNKKSALQNYQSTKSQH